jgi:hypothetical protein
MWLEGFYRKIMWLELLEGIDVFLASPRKPAPLGPHVTAPHIPAPRISLTFRGSWVGFMQPARVRSWATKGKKLPRAHP